MENPIKMDDLGCFPHIFGSTPYCLTKDFQLRHPVWDSYFYSRETTCRDFFEMGVSITNPIPYARMVYLPTFS